MLGSCEDLEGEGEESAATPAPAPAPALALTPLLPAEAAAIARMGELPLAGRVSWVRVRVGAFVRTSRELSLLPVPAGVCA